MKCIELKNIQTSRIPVPVPVFLVILDTVIITQLNRRFSHVPNLIREVTALRWDV